MILLVYLLWIIIVDSICVVYMYIIYGLIVVSIYAALQRLNYVYVCAFYISCFLEKYIYLFILNINSHIYFLDYKLKNFNFNIKTIVYVYIYIYSHSLNSTAFKLINKLIRLETQQNKNIYIQISLLLYLYY